MDTILINEEKQKQIDEFYSAIGFDLAQKENHLNLLASTYEKEYFSYLLSIIPNVSNIDIIPLSNLACLLATFRQLNQFISKCNENIELYLKLISKRNEVVTKIDMLLKSYGLNGSGRDKLIIAYQLEEE